MDISELKPTERMVDILHPVTEEPTGIKVSLMALTDPKMKKVQRRIQDERIRLETRGKSFKAEDIEENENLLIFSSMTGWLWEGDAKYEGGVPDFNEANVKKILKELPWFKMQIAQALGEEKAFFQI